MSLFRQRTSQKGFTLIEILIIAPIVILTIGAFLTVIISVTGEVLASRGSNQLTYNVQDTMNRIEQDVKLSSVFLAQNNITPASPQGYNDATSNFTNVGGATGPMLILNVLVTNDNPLTLGSGVVYLSNQPNGCGTALVQNNVPMTMNVIYYIKGTTLWRRTVMPSNYASTGCSTPWQRPSCSVGYTDPFCKTNDVRLVDGVNPSSFFIQYFTTTNATLPNTVASNTSSSVTDRNTALFSTPTVVVSLTANQVVAGRTIERAATMRATRLETNATTVAAPPVQSALSGPPTKVNTSGNTNTSATVNWTSPSGTPTSYTLQYSKTSSFSSPTTISNITSTTKTITGLTTATGYFFKVSATNSTGTTAYSTGVLGYTTGTNPWSSYTKLTGVGDWNNDGKNDILGYTSIGDVRLHTGNGDGTFNGGILLTNIGSSVVSFIGPGTLPSGTAPIMWWTDTGGGGYALKSNGQYSISGSTITSAPAGSFSSCMDVFASPFQYTNNTTVIVNCHANALGRWGLSSGGVATFIASSGGGWNGYAADTVFGGGDFSVDGKGDILVTNSAGTLIFYQGDGAGFVTSNSTQGSGWLNNRVTSGWDYTGDNKTDILRYVTTTNILYLYTGCGCGTTSTSFVVN
ncbi:MAG: fibronectin type III domain-containing protein [Candidatus Saccharimonadales bacterium]